MCAPPQRHDSYDHIAFTIIYDRFQARLRQPGLQPFLNNHKTIKNKGYFRAIKPLSLHLDV